MAKEARPGTNGLWELWDNGQRVSSGTEQFIKSQVTSAPPPPALTPAPAPTINRTVDNPASDPAVQAAEAHLNAFRTPESYEDILEKKRKSVQGLIDAGNKIYDDQVTSIKERGNERLAERGAMNIMGGIAGSPRAFANRDKVATGTEKEVEAKNQERAAYLAEIYMSLESDAREEARFQADQATKSAEGILTRDKEKQTKALDSLKNMAATGALDFDSFKTDPANKQVYDYALRTFGGSEEALKGFIALNKPKDTVLTEGTTGNKFYRVTQNPVTGKVSNEIFDLGFEIPPEYEHVQLGDELLFFPKGKSMAEAMADGSAYTYKASQTEEDKVRLEGLRLQNEKARRDLTKAPDDPKRDTTIEEINGKKYLIDNQTGETIKELGNSEGDGVTAAGPIKPNTLTDLVLQYRDAVQSSTKIGRYASPAVKKELDSLRGQITATYKQEKKLGTLDAGVQKLIEGIIGSQPTLLGTINPFSGQNESGLLSAVDSFLKNEGGVDLSNLTELRNQVQSGEILVIDRETRAIGAIPKDEFNASKYIKL